MLTLQPTLLLKLIQVRSHSISCLVILIVKFDAYLAITRSALQHVRVNGYNSVNGLTIDIQVSIPIAKLWESSYTPPARSESLPEFYSFERKNHISNIISVQFCKVNYGMECSGIEIKGPNLDVMVQEFVARLHRAAQCQDWTPLLCESRTFIQ